MDKIFIKFICYVCGFLNNSIFIFKYSGKSTIFFFIIISGEVLWATYGVDKVHFIYFHLREKMFHLN